MKNKIFLAVLAVIVLSGLGSCKKDFVSINTDPNHITAANINYAYLFTNAQMIASGNSDANGYEDWRNNLIYSSCMIQHLSSIQGYWDGDKYFYNAGYNSAYWDDNYNNTVTNIVEVVTHTATDANQTNFYNIARIFKVFMFQRMTDMYGDCPYSEAGLGFIKGITQPKYDKQQDIYANMLSELADAAGKLDPGKPNTVGKADLLYGGDPAQWKKFAFSEMVRIAMRMSKVDATNAQKWVQTAVQGGVMASNDDNAIVAHQALTGTPVPNGTGLILIGNDPNAYRLSQTFVDYLKSTSDPRLSYLATVCADPTDGTDKGDTTWANQLGQPNGHDAPGSGSAYDLSKVANWPGDANKYSVVNRYTFSRLDAPTFLLTYGETQLLLAEAAQRGWVTGTPAATYYNNGVTGSMAMLGAQAGAGPSDAAIAAYLTANPYNAGSALNQINTQYWVASFMDENESFANWRRSGFPVLTPVNYPGNVTNGTIPRRFTYPQGEASTNTANYTSAVSGLNNGDKMTSRVWWDVQ
ncbi:MAG TPA: SusD/RagB family nutrient-binding outer membrane lipoprotein [Puia sp.]|uniref:SusD/RagB family nutrient-binding outer membrane lipoprotein n=1 Tax=Puia sp. TaxID=2045100 RepID=UPI002BDA835F|nr:SusD/RagB family nutrient-binding outer membrane lipoprotein [Puia sp.]HVU96756.1 SusD/RagB family nutrient-binding outer membrane lipoprotein [Puia sp.]